MNFLKISHFPHFYVIFPRFFTTFPRFFTNKIFQGSQGRERCGSLNPRLNTISWFIKTMMCLINKGEKLLRNDGVKWKSKLIQYNFVILPIVIQQLAISYIFNTLFDLTVNLFTLPPVFCTLDIFMFMIKVWLVCRVFSSIYFSFI